jgi:hypothetical protein
MRLLPGHEPVKTIVRLCCIITIALVLFVTIMQYNRGERIGAHPELVLAIIGLIWSLQKKKPKTSKDGTMVNTIRQQCGEPNCGNDATQHAVYRDGQGFGQGEYCDDHFEELQKQDPDARAIPLYPNSQSKP